MIPPASEFNYKAILEECMKKDYVSDQIESNKNTFDYKYWMAVCKNMEEKGKSEIIQEDNNMIRSSISNRVDTLTSLNKEDAIYKKKLNQLEADVTEKKKCKENNMNAFFIEIEELNHNIKKTPVDFDNKYIYDNIKSNTITIKRLEKEIDHVTKDMDNTKTFIENSTYVVPPTTNQATEIIDKENLIKYGNPTKLQKRLSEIHNHIELLRKKKTDIKMKYNI